MKTLEGETINRETSKYKFGGDPMAEYLYILSMNDNDYIGESDYGLWASKFGRRILMSNDQGFVWVNKFDTEEEALAEWKLIEAEYNSWLNANDEEND